MKLPGRTAALCVVAACLGNPLAHPDVRAQELLLGAGPQHSVEHQLGRAICRLVNRHAPGDVSCRVLETADAEFNLDNVNGGAIELGLVPSDLQYHAVHGTGPFQFKDVSYADLRAVFSVHQKAFAVVARRDAGVRRLYDLAGRRVNIGNWGSPQRAAMEDLMEAKQWSAEDFQLMEELPADQQSLALCHGRIQAMVVLAVHPDQDVERAMSLCDAKLVDISGTVLDTLLRENPFYSTARIAGGLYPRTPRPLQTFGSRITLVASTAVEADVIRAITAAIFGHLDALRRMHPAFGSLDPEEMSREGLSAPLHDGARMHFEEAGLR